MLSTLTASKALALLDLFMPIEVGYITDPRNEGTETASATSLPTFPTLLARSPKLPVKT